ncbi:MAG: hypothetical protein MK226_15460 [Saprospiraceae bacterium]|nr:hypothetical protein [Saprospiraceae bacterium]
MKNSKKFFKIGFLILVVAGLISNRYYRKRELVKFQEFYQTDVSGKLYSIIDSNTGAQIVLSETKEKFTFSPFTSFLNQKKRFAEFAKKGDFVTKPAFSDTLKLFKNGQVYLYTFRKYD